MLDEIDRGSISPIPKTKVFILARQYKEIPTTNWKILKTKVEAAGGQVYILQINREAEDLLLPHIWKDDVGFGERAKARK